MPTWILTLASRPGPWQYYQGTVTVWAVDEEDALRRAHARLRVTFPERPASAWSVDTIKEVLCQPFP